MAELADAGDLKSPRALPCAGSSPALGTLFMKAKFAGILIFVIFLCPYHFLGKDFQQIISFKIKGSIVKASATKKKLFLGVNSFRKAAVLVIEFNKKSFKKIGEFGKGKKQYYFIQDLEVNLKLGRVFVLDRRGKILIYDMDGNFKKDLSLNLPCVSFLHIFGPERFIVKCIKGIMKKKKIYTEVYLYEHRHLKKILSFPNLTAILKDSFSLLLSLSEPAIAFDGRYFYVQNSTLYQIHKFNGRGKRLFSKIIDDKVQPDFSRQEKLLRGSIIKKKKPFAACRLFWDKKKLWVLTNIWKGEKRRLDVLNKNLKRLKTFFVKGTCRHFWISNGFIIAYDPRTSLLSINALTAKNEMSRK